MKRREKSQLDSFRFTKSTMITIMKIQVNPKQIHAHSHTPSKTNTQRKALSLLYLTKSDNAFRLNRMEGMK